MEVPERVRSSILSTGLAISGGGFNHCISGVMESVISLGLLTEMLRESRPLYRVRAPCYYKYLQQSESEKNE